MTADDEVEYGVHLPLRKLRSLPLLVGPAEVCAERLASLVPTPGR